MTIGVCGRGVSYVSTGASLFHLVEGGPCHVCTLLRGEGVPDGRPVVQVGWGAAVGGKGGPWHRSCGAKSRGAARGRSRAGPKIRGAYGGEVQKRTSCRRRGRPRPGADVGGSPGSRLGRRSGRRCFRHGAAGGSQGSKGCENTGGNHTNGERRMVSYMHGRTTGGYRVTVVMYRSLLSWRKGLHL